LLAFCNNLAAADRFIPGFGITIGIGIFEGNKIVYTYPVVRTATRPNDVIIFPSLEITTAAFILHAMEIIEAEVRFSPMDAVCAFCIAGDGRVRNLICVFVCIRAPIVHAKNVTVAENGVVCGGVAFPWQVVFDNNLARNGMMELLFCFDQLFDQHGVDKQFPLIRDVDHAALSFCYCKRRPNPVCATGPSSSCSIEFDARARAIFPKV